MAAPVRHNETSHSTLLCHRWQPGRGAYVMPALAGWSVPQRLRRPSARVKRHHEGGAKISSGLHMKKAQTLFGRMITWFAGWGMVHRLQVHNPWEQGDGSWVRAMSPGSEYYRAAWCWGHGAKLSWVNRSHTRLGLLP
jgi:hypothetical protein